jgi:DNA modification methylase
MEAKRPLERGVKDLISHAESVAFYGTNDDNFDELVQSIKHYGILQPIIVYGNEVQVGNRRLRAALELGMETVPVIESDGPFAMGKVVASQLHRNKPYSIIIKELSYLDEVYGIRQGSRTDLRKDVFEEVEKWKETLAGSRNAMQRLRKIQRMSTVAFENKPGDYDKFLKKLDDGTYTITRGLELLRELVQKAMQVKHSHLMNLRESAHNIYLKDAFGFEEVADQSVQCIVTSPPYFRMRDFGLGDNQLGQERSPKKFAFRLAEFMDESRRVLKPEGSLWVVINDTVHEGCYTISPHLFAMYMMKKGWILNDEIIWRKANPTPTTARRTVRANEFIFHFVLNREFKYNDISNDPKRFTYRGQMSNNFMLVPSVNNAQKRRICAENGVRFTHSATFPEYVPLIPILLTTDPGDLVMDMFAGTGTTGIVAKQVNRDFVGYEMNPEYFNIANTLLTHYKSLSMRLDEDAKSTENEEQFYIPIGIEARSEERQSNSEESSDYIGEVA